MGGWVGGEGRKVRVEWGGVGWSGAGWGGVGWGGQGWGGVGWGGGGGGGIGCLPLTWCLILDGDTHTHASAALPSPRV